MTPARQAKILQAYNLRAQGFTLRQIARQLGCAHSTVSQYIKDFERSRDLIVRNIAADQLLHILLNLHLVDPQHREHSSSIFRELRLLLASTGPELEQQDQLEDFILDGRYQQLLSGLAEPEQLRTTPNDKSEPRRTPPNAISL